MVATADTEDRRTGSRPLEQHRLDARFAQPLQICQRVFRAGNDDEIRFAQIRGALHVAHANALNRIEGDEIGEVRYLGKPDDGNVDQRFGTAHVQTVRQAVLIVDVEQRIGNDPRDGKPTAFAQNLETGVEDGLVAAELVDDEALHVAPLLVVEQHERAEQLREHTATIDVARQQHGRFRHLGHAHVHDVVVLEVDFGRTARTFDDDDVEAACQIVISAHDVGHKLVLVSEVLTCAHRAEHMTVDDHLRTRVVCRFQQNRVHSSLGRHASSFGLHNLSASHLGAFCRDGRVERHVLRLERRHAIAVLREYATQARREQTFARS